MTYALPAVHFPNHISDLKRFQTPYYCSRNGGVALSMSGWNTPTSSTSQHVLQPFCRYILAAHGCESHLPFFDRVFSLFLLLLDSYNLPHLGALQEIAYDLVNYVVILSLYQESYYSPQIQSMSGHYMHQII